MSAPLSTSRPDHHDQDLWLMKRVADGDRAAQQRLASLLCGRIRRVQRGLLGDEQDAEDATQETIIEILRCASSFRGDASLLRWADRIAIRTGLRQRRRWRRNRRDWNVEPDELATATTLAPGDDRLPRPLLTYLDGLPAVERRALFLKHGLGYSVAEVAELMDAAVSTTKYRLVAALARVRKSIRRDLFVGGERT